MPRLSRPKSSASPSLSCPAPWLTLLAHPVQPSCRTQILDAMFQQAKKLSLTSRAFFNDALGEYEEYITKLLGYDKVHLSV